MSREAVARYRHLLPADEMARLIEVLGRPLAPAIRVNTLKIAVAEAARIWPEWYGWRIRPVPFCSAGWQLVECATSPGGTLEHRMGFYYVQDAASMLPAEMFHWTEKELLILDLAASPGGKTTHLACKSDDRGLIIANDASASRIAALCANLQDAGVLSSVVTHYPGERFGYWFPEVFDRVLLDAPCSGESLRASERRKARPISEKERRRLHQRQVGLLMSAFQALKPGGEVVYATCTLSPDENEATLDALLREYPQQASIESLSHVLPIPAPALVSDGERDFHPAVRLAARLWPHLYDTSGFFAALICKRAPIIPRPQPPPARPLAAAGFRPLDRWERAALADELLQVYGFDLEAVLDSRALTLWIRGAHIQAIPEAFLSRFADLPCVLVGFPIGERSEEGIVPSHELAARFAPFFTSGRLTLSENQAAFWLAGRDLRGHGMGQYPMGRVVIVEDSRGRFLGRGKVLEGRLRNLLPRRLTA